MTVIVYPSAIARACSALDESIVFRELPDGYVRVVLRIIKKINLARPTSPIVASRGTLAEESGKSIETVGRVVKWLEDRGLVKRAQKAYAGLRGSSSPLTPTRALLDALLLTQSQSEQEPMDLPQKAAGANKVDQPQPSPVRSDGSISTELNQPTGIQPGVGAFVRIQKVVIPSELAWLVTEQELRATGVLALMKLARQVNQRLSDVVTATRKYLVRLKGGELFAYLRALIGKDRDYGYLVREEVKVVRDIQQHQRIEEKAEALQGRQFTDRSGEIIVIVESRGILTEIRNGQRFCRHMDQLFLDAIEDGRLIGVRDDDLSEQADFG